MQIFSDARADTHEDHAISVFLMLVCSCVSDPFASQLDDEFSRLWA
jgi:hypothetical protein